MCKDNDRRDIRRRYKRISQLQEDIDNPQDMPAANAKWRTALIVVPVSVTENWKRELDTVSGDESDSARGSNTYIYAVLTVFTFCHSIDHSIHCFQWGYFEVGMYVGSKEHLLNVLTDFKLGRLDLSESSPLGLYPLAFSVSPL
jgi:hypothetical protein